MIPPSSHTNPVLDEALLRLRVSAFNYPPGAEPGTAIVALADLQSLVRHVDRLHNELREHNRFLADSVPW